MLDAAIFESQMFLNTLENISGMINKLNKLRNS